MRALSIGSYKLSIYGNSKTLARNQLDADNPKLTAVRVFELSRGKREVFSFALTNDLQVWDATMWRDDRDRRIPYPLQIAINLLWPEKWLK